MKKLLFMAIVALVAGLSACSGDKKTNDANQDATAEAEQAAAAQEQAQPVDIMVAAEALVKKIDNKETLTEADAMVACDYMIAFYEDMQKNPTDVDGLLAKYKDGNKIADAFDNFDFESASPELKAKVEKIKTLKE